jgi:hypothetical protein
MELLRTTTYTEDMLTINQALVVLDFLSRYELRREVESGRLRSVKLYGRRLIPSTAIPEFLDFCLDGLSDLCDEDELRRIKAEEIQAALARYAELSE